MTQCFLITWHFHFILTERTLSGFFEHKHLKINYTWAYIKKEHINKFNLLKYFFNFFTIKFSILNHLETHGGSWLATQHHCLCRGVHWWSCVSQGCSPTNSRNFHQLLDVLYHFIWCHLLLTRRCQARQLGPDYHLVNYKCKNGHRHPLQDTLWLLIRSQCEKMRITDLMK